LPHPVNTLRWTTNSTAGGGGIRQRKGDGSAVVVAPNDADESKDAPKPAKGGGGSWPTADVGLFAATSRSPCTAGSAMGNFVDTTWFSTYC
jgi:hypothetical protein